MIDWHNIINWIPTIISLVGSLLSFRYTRKCKLYYQNKDITEALKYIVELQKIKIQLDEKSNQSIQGIKGSNNPKEFYKRMLPLAKQGLEKLIAFQNILTSKLLKHNSVSIDDCKHFLNSIVMGELTIVILYLMLLMF